MITGKDHIDRDGLHSFRHQPYNGKTEGFGSAHTGGIVGFVMADGATSFIPESINSNAAGTNGQKFNAANTAARVAAAKNVARGVYQKLSVRNDGNATSLPE